MATRPIAASLRTRVGRIDLFILGSSLQRAAVYVEHQAPCDYEYEHQEDERLGRGQPYALFGSETGEVDVVAEHRRVDAWSALGEELDRVEERERSDHPEEEDDGDHRSQQGQLDLR